MNIFRKILVHKVKISPIVYVKIRNLIWSLRLYKKYSIGHINKKNTFFFIIDPQIPQPGFADRIKAIVYAAHKAKMSGLSFHLIWDGLTKYLEPSKNIDSYKNWISDFSDLEYIFNGTKNWSLYLGKKNSLPPLKRKGKQYHCRFYCGNMAPFRFEDNGDLWNEEYNRLFKETEFLNYCIKSSGLYEKKYISVHLRFVNALENFEKDFNNNLSKEEQKHLIIRCKDAINLIKEKNQDKDVAVFSDSKVFLDSLKDMDVIVLDSNNIGHIGMDNHNNVDTLGKTILDFYLISRSVKVYSIGCKEIYANSGFPQIAALMGNVPFERVEA